MNKDPYQILGVSPDATDDEVKKAYRVQAKKYHPDNFSDSPLREQAESKMKEINEAYDKIQKIRSGEGDFSDFGGTSSQTGSRTGVYYQIRVHINEGRFSEADLLLNSVPVSSRTAEWHFLKGCILFNRGWYYDAEASMRTACEMDPSNSEYRSGLDSIRSRAQAAGSPYRTATRTDDCSVCDICQMMMCANCLCNCFGGGC